MKRLLLPLLALWAVGCGQEQVETVDETNDPIQFDVAVGKHEPPTRATEFGYWQTGGSFPVKAYQTGHTETTTVYDFTLTYVGPGTTAWSYETAQSQKFSVTYYAWWPTTTVTALDSTTNGTQATITYTIPGTQEDLIAAMRVTPESRVVLWFYHLLSEVNFAVQGVLGTHINVTNIQVNGVQNSGLYTFGATGGNWSGLTGSANYPYTPLTGLLPTTGSDDSLVYLGNKGGGVPTDNDNDNALMLMPQSFTSGTGGNFSLDYNITDMDNNVLKSGSTTVYFGDLPTSGTWEMGKRYVYLLDFRSLLEGGPVTFEVIVATWQDPINHVALPIIIADVTQISLEDAINNHNTNKGNTSTLTVFPITVPSGLTIGSAITLTDFTDTNFVTGDQIRIWCNTAANAANILLDASHNATWSRSVSGSVVTLTHL